MALTADQRAMLQLLLERDQSYDDIASLLGTSQDDVRRRARAAVTELAGKDPDREVGLTDYLLGEADPIGRADAVRHLQADPDSMRLAEDVIAKLCMVAPDAELPELPEARGRRRPRIRRGAAASADGRPSDADDQPEEAVARQSRFSGISSRQSRLFAALGAAGVLLLVIVLAIAGVFGGDDEGTAAPTPTTTGDTTSAQTEDLTTVQLQPQGGGSASGEAVFGLASGDQPYLDLQLQNLEPAPEGQTYVTWFLLSDKKGYPLAPLTPEANQTFSDRFAIPQVVLPIAARTQFIDISLVNNEQLAGDLQKAIKGNKVLLNYQGESVLRGEIPEAQGAPGAGAQGG
jgi:hypothetical protein